MISHLQHVQVYRFQRQITKDKTNANELKNISPLKNRQMMNYFHTICLNAMRKNEARKLLFNVG